MNKTSVRKHKIQHIVLLYFPQLAIMPHLLIFRKTFGKHRDTICILSFLTDVFVKLDFIIISTVKFMGDLSSSKTEMCCL